MADLTPSRHRHRLSPLPDEFVRLLITTTACAATRRPRKATVPWSNSSPLVKPAARHLVPDCSRAEPVYDGDLPEAKERKMFSGLVEDA